MLRRYSVKMQTRSTTMANEDARLLSRVDSHSPKTEFCTEVVTFVMQVLNERGPDQVSDPGDFTVLAHDPH